MILAMSAATVLSPLTAFADAEEQELNIAIFQGGYGDAYWNQMVELFEESHEGVKVNMTISPTIGDIIRPQIVAGNVPDFICLNDGGEDGVILSLIKEHALLNLNDVFDGENYAGTGTLRDDITDGILASSKCAPYGDGDIYLAPFNSGPQGLIYNKTFFDENNLEVPKTWEEMADTCKKLKDGGYSDFGFSQPRDIWYFWMMVETYGGPVFSEDGLKLDCLDNGSAVEAFNLLQGMVKDDTFRPAPTTEGANTIKGWFSGGECAFLVQSVGALNEIRSACEESGVNMEIAQIPGHEIDGKVRYAVPYGGNTMVMLESSQHKDAAWKFMQWLYTSEDGIAYFDDNTGYLACSGTVKNTELLKAKAANDADWARAHEYLDTIVTDYLIEASGDVVEDLTAFMDAVFYDAEDPKTALEEQRANVEEILADHEGRP